MSTSWDDAEGFSHLWHIQRLVNFEGGFHNVSCSTWCRAAWFLLTFHLDLYESNGSQGVSKHSQQRLVSSSPGKPEGHQGSSFPQTARCSNSSRLLLWNDDWGATCMIYQLWSSICVLLWWFNSTSLTPNDGICSPQSNLSQCHCITMYQVKRNRNLNSTLLAWRFDMRCEHIHT